MTDLLKITPEEVQKRRNPTGDTMLFTVGDSPGQYPRADCIALISDWDEYVCSRIPERYRSALTEINGEILIEYAKGGETTAKVGLVPLVAGSLVLYKNYFRQKQQGYDLRTPAESLNDGWTVDANSGVVTFDTALVQGDQIIADYKHEGAGQLRYLRRVALNLIIADLVEQYPSMSDQTQSIEKLRQQAYGDLDRLKRGESGLQVIDQLKLVDIYETRNATNTINFEMPGGFL